MTLHIANIHFESELEGKVSSSEDPIALQLQFLPLIYGNNEDGLVVTHAPYPSLTRLKLHLWEDRDFSYERVDSWGASQHIATWAKDRGLTYDIPPWNVVKQVNSKDFAFDEKTKLPGSALLFSWDDVIAWMSSFEEAKVLKTCFGVAGKGHLLLPTDSKRLKKFAEKEFSAQRPLIGEPWVERKLDFSTQWMVHRDGIEYLGATVCLNDERGRHIGNRIGEPPSNFLEAHKEEAFCILQKIADLGFFGNVGIDSMIWGNDILQPIVEINARKTMGWVALEYAKPLSYVANSEKQSLLPEAVVRNDGSLIHFSRKLIIIT